MKNVVFKTLIFTFILAGICFNSCQRDEFTDDSVAASGALKSAAVGNPALPLFMDQTTQIGYANIIHDPVAATFNVSLDLSMLEEGWEVTCGHLYAGAAAPASASPGLFPYSDCDGEILFEGITGPEDLEECGNFTWYFALHLELKKMILDENGDPVLGEDGLPTYEHETAWLLPGNGENWKNKGKGNNVGWGQYFKLTFDYALKISELQLLYTTDLDADPVVWTPAEEGFNMCLDATVPFYYFDTEMVSSVPLNVDVKNEFYLNEVTDPDFWTYWAGKGVDGINNAQGWELAMWSILTGTSPMFYLVWDGSDYSLVDGLQYLGGATNPLRINGTYPPGTYSFTGTISSEYCTIPKTFSLTVAPCALP